MYSNDDLSWPLTLVLSTLLAVQVRSTISDFAVFLTIMFMVLLDYLVGIPSPKLNVPDTFEVKHTHTQVLFTHLPNKCVCV